MNDIESNDLRSGKIHPEEYEPKFRMALEYLQEQASDDLPEVQMRLIAYDATLLGRVAHSKKQYHWARKFYKLAYKIVEGFDDNESMIFNLALLEENESDSGNTEAARKYFIQACQLIDQQTSRERDK